MRTFSDYPAAKAAALALASNTILDVYVFKTNQGYEVHPAFASRHIQGRQVFLAFPPEHGRKNLEAENP